MRWVRHRRLRHLPSAALRAPPIEIAVGQPLPCAASSPPRRRQRHCPAARPEQNLTPVTGRTLPPPRPLAPPPSPPKLSPAAMRDLQLVHPHPCPCPAERRPPRHRLAPRVAQRHLAPPPRGRWPHRRSRSGAPGPSPPTLLPARSPAGRHPPKRGPYRHRQRPCRLLPRRQDLVTIAAPVAAGLPPEARATTGAVAAGG
jgi:hypothetical protein